MPEGDVVWYTARRLHEALAGRTLTRSDFRVPRLATTDLTGDMVTETVACGKHLLTRHPPGRGTLGLRRPGLVAVVLSPDHVAAARS